MFNSYDMTRAFVAERQQTLRHETRQHHLGRGRRRGHGEGRRRRVAAVPALRPAPSPAPPARTAGGCEEQLAA